MKVIEDDRMGGETRYVLSDSEDFLMQIPDEVRKCAAFIGVQKKEELLWKGSAFFVSVPIPDTERHAVYLVTARHVLDGIKERSVDGMVHVRCNIREGGVQRYEVNLHEWIVHPQLGVDVAAISFWDSRLDHKPISLSNFVTQNVIEKEHIGIGDELFLTGLFRDHYGQHRNIPIIRVGNIASMPEEPVMTTSMGRMDAYLVESRSIGGLSGSPVFTYIGATRYRGETLGLGGRRRFYFLGLMHGHWDMPHTVEDSRTEEGVNMGIAIVVPAEKIREVLDDKEFVAQREQLRLKWIMDRSPTPD